MADLMAEPMILMTAGYLMHRYVHRLLAGQTPEVSYSTDGAEMGTLMVAEGLGAAVLPDFSVIGDTEVQLAVRRGRSGMHLRAARDLHGLLVAQAAAYDLAA